MQPIDPVIAPESYRPSGRLHLERFLKAWAVLLCAAAALASWSRDNIEGFGGFPFVTSGAPGLIGFAGVWLAVRYGACRNPRAGLLLGLSVGLVAFLGSYHVDQCRQWGAGRTAFHRLPGYILFRLETDTIRKDESGLNRVAVEPAPGITPSRPPSWPNRWTWALFGFDAFFLVGLPALAGWAAARRPFDERIGVWLSRQRAYIALGEEPAFLAALGAGRLMTWADELKYKPAVHDSDALIAIWFVADSNGWAVPGHDAFVSFAGGRLWRVPADQTAALGEQAAALGEQAAVLRTLIQPADPAGPAKAAAGETAVTATTLPAEWSANLGASRHLFATWLMVNVLGNVPYLAVVLGMVAAMFLFTKENGLADTNVQILYGFTGAVAFVLFYLAWLKWSLTNPWANVLRYQSARLREAVGKREGVGFDADDPRVVLAQVWLPVADGQPINRPAWELGYLMFDEDRGAVSFEGDRHRVVIPAGAVAGFDSRMEHGISIEGSAVCVLSVVTRSEAGEVRIEVIPERGIAGTTYHAREEALRIRWQHLVDGKPLSD
jgi:hypothetical protein